MATVLRNSNGNIVADHRHAAFMLFSCNNVNKSE